MLEDIKNHIRETLTEERYRHSLNVADEAARLARFYGYDEEKAYLAGLLHDIGKVKDKSLLLKMGFDFDIILKENSQRMGVVEHCILGRAIAHRKFKIFDKEILDSIRYHTTGRANMGLLEKIVFIADYIEIGRDFEGVETARELAYSDLDRAMVFSLENTMIHVVKRGLMLHEDTVRARNYLLKKLVEVKK